MESTGAGGRTIAGRYRLTALLGQGGMGSVWRAEDLTLDSPVAIKLIDPMLAVEPTVRARFCYEARAAAQLRSPHVVQILDYGVDDGTPFIAMELLEGESLAGRLARDGVLSSTDAGRILGDVARAIRRAHDAGIVHRDLKPENVFLVRNDDHDVAKVLDFGIAKAAETATGAARGRTQTGVLVGTPAYMSPEQTRGTPVDHRADLWALGVIAFECLCGRHPFPALAGGELVLQICADPIPVPSEVASVPGGFDVWMARALAREPDERFQSAKEMIDALRPVLEGDADAVARARGAAPAPRPQKPSIAAFARGSGAAPHTASRPRVATWLSAGALAVTLASAAISLRGRHDVASRSAPSSGADLGQASAAAASGPPAVTEQRQARPPEETTPRPGDAAPQATAAARASSAPRGGDATRDHAAAAASAHPAPLPSARPADSAPVDPSPPKAPATVAPPPVETALPAPPSVAPPAPKSKDRIGF